MSEILEPFVKTLTADKKYSSLNKQNLRYLIQMQCSKNQKKFSELFTAFPNSTSNFEHSDKEVTFIITFFEIYRLRKMCLE